MSDLMATYNDQLTDEERAAIECALDEFKTCCVDIGVKLDMSDPSARAAEALAKYIVESREAEARRLTMAELYLLGQQRLETRIPNVKKEDNNLRTTTTFGESLEKLP